MTKGSRKREERLYRGIGVHLIFPYIAISINIPCNFFKQTDALEKHVRFPLHLGHFSILEFFPTCLIFCF